MNTDFPPSCSNQEQAEHSTQREMSHPSGYQGLRGQHLNTSLELWRKCASQPLDDVTCKMACHHRSPTSFERPEKGEAPQIMNMYPLLERTRILRKQQHLSENNDYNMGDLNAPDKQQDNITVEIHTGSQERREYFRY